MKTFAHAVRSLRAALVAATEPAKKGESATVRAARKVAENEDALALVRYQMFLSEAAPCSPTGKFHEVLVTAGYDAMGRSLRDESGKVVKEVRTVEYTVRQLLALNRRKRQRAAKRLQGSVRTLGRHIDASLYGNGGN